MSPPERFTRRRLLSLLRGDAQKPEPRPAHGFSLEAFYSARAAAPGATSTPPMVHLRPGLEFTPATRVGVPELATTTAPKSSEQP